MSELDEWERDRAEEFNGIRPYGYADSSRFDFQDGRRSVLDSEEVLGLVKAVEGMVRHADSTGLASENAWDALEDLREWLARYRSLAGKEDGNG